MIDIKKIRENRDEVEKMLAARNFSIDLDHILKIDDTRIDLLQKIEDLRAEKNAAAESRDIERGRQVKEKLEKLSPALAAVEEEFWTAFSQIPNLLAEDVPTGKDESENKVIRTWGEPKKFNFKPLNHLELGQKLGIIDTEKAAKISGARFNYLIGDAVLLELALLNFALNVLSDQKLLEKLAKKHGVSAKPFTPVIPPAMIRPEVFRKMARLDKDVEEERYYLPKDDVYLIGSAEHTLGPLHMGESLNEKDLPIRYVGFSPSFRREAGSYGKDTKGIIRVHQFDKVEMESFTSSEMSIKEQEFIVSIQEHLLQELEIPYQVMMICSGDMASPDFRQIDLNAWLPGQDSYKETHTSDLMTDYQSRRLKTTVKYKDGKTGYAHMNDATAFAIGRTLVAILENYQEQDGTVTVPRVLRDFIRKDTISGPK